MQKNYFHIKFSIEINKVQVFFFFFFKQAYNTLHNQNTTIKGLNICNSSLGL